MLRRFLLPFVLGAFSLVAQAQVEAPTTLIVVPVSMTGANVLDVHNTLLAAFKLDSSRDRVARAKTWLQLFEPQRYASNMQDEASLLAEATIKAGEIDAELAGLPSSLSYSLDVPAQSVEVQGQRVRISTALDSGHYSLATNFGSTDPEFPPVFEFSFPNAARFAWFEVSQGRAVEMTELLKSEGPQQVYVRVQLELLKVKDHRQFQAVVRQLDWYSDFGRSHLITSLSDLDPAHS